MPWEIVQEDPACPASRPFGVHKTDDGELEGCHATYADADDQMSALYMAESEDEQRQEDSYEPPQGVRDAAQRALEWIAEGLAGDGFTDVGRRRASQLANGEPVSRETIGRMANYFGRHASDRDAEGFNSGEDGFPSPGRVAWDAWGGDAGRSWSQGIIDAEDSRSMDCGERMMDSTYQRTDDGVTVPDREVRQVERLELRQSDDGLPMIEGYATIYNYGYDIGGGPDMGGFTEVIAPGAAKKSAKEADVRLLADHAGLPLARTRSGTLELESDDIGLRVRATLDPTNPAAQQVRSAMERGDVDQMSFAFRVVRDEWNRDYTERTISEVKLYDVSVVTYPANPATVVKLRADETPSEDAAEDTPKSSGRSVANARRVAGADRDRKRR